ncbi:MAG: GNAT family N-acetyltransferase [Alphaproteobacteria bacterium]|nr:GNAT family N-acetyltransferase [Alphaproteobacteria bacterium]
MDKIIPLSIPGAELRFLEPTPANAAELFNVIDANREYIAPWRNSTTVKKIGRSADALSALEKYKTEWNERSKFTYWIFFDGKLVGNAQLENLNFEHGSGNIGYWLAADYTGRGIATSAIAALEKIAFVELGLSRLEIRLSPGNERSENLALRAGYVYEGTARQDYLSTYNNTRNDSKVFSKLKSEYKG